MKVKQLLPGQPVTANGDAGSAVLIEVIQRLVLQVKAVEAENRALRAEAEALTLRVEALEP